MELDSAIIRAYTNATSWTTNLIHQKWHRKRYLKEALDTYSDDYIDNEVIFGDMMDILSARMSAAVDEVNKAMDLKDKLKNA